MFRLFLVVLSFLFFTQVQAEALDKIVAVVNEDVITESQVDMLVGQMHAQIAHSNMTAPSEYTLREEALNQLINQSVELQLAQKSKVEVSDAELNQAINNIALQNHTTVAELQTKIESEGGFSNFAQFKKQIKNQMIVSKLQQLALGSTVTVTEAQVNQAVQKARQEQQGQAEYDLSDVLIPLPENPSTAQLQEAQKRAADIIQQLKAGKDVNELTTTVTSTTEPTNKSASPSFFSKITDLFKSSPKEEEQLSPANPTPEDVSVQNLSLRKKADLPEVFAAKLESSKAGNIVGPIQTANGLHILRVNQVKLPPELNVNPEMIRNQLYQKAIMEKLPAWLEKMRKTAYIKINP